MAVRCRGESGGFGEARGEALEARSQRGPPSIVRIQTSRDGASRSEYASELEASDHRLAARCLIATTVALNSTFRPSR
jgi:hypothetical protein